MKPYIVNIDKIPTRILSEDLGRRDKGFSPAERVDALSSFVQKGAIICLAGILPLGAAREFEPTSIDRGLAGVGIENERSSNESSRSMDLSTLQDLVSGVGVILTTDFSLPRPAAVAERRGGNENGIEH